MTEMQNNINYEVINEVSKKLLDEGSIYDIDKKTICSLQEDWIRNLEFIQKEAKNEVKENEMGEVYDDEEMEEIEKRIKNYILCLYVKVTKTKNKWKCIFKQGFVNPESNEDIPFTGATGELEW